MLQCIVERSSFSFNEVAFRFSGKGIVTTLTFGRVYFTNVYIALRVLRESVHSQLPIEVMYAAEDGPPPPSIIAHMHATFKDVKFIDLHNVADFPAGLNLKGYQIKPFAIMYSSFEEVLYLDSDIFPLVDPKWVFELALYKESGAVFWPVCDLHGDFLTDED